MSSEHDNPDGVDADPSGARAVANDAMREVIDLRRTHEDDLDDVWDAIEAVLERVSEVEDRTDLLAATRKAEATSREEKATICIQTLVNEARERPEGKQTAYMTAKEGVKALGGGIDRTNLYQVFPKAEELVGNEDVCYFVEEPRGADPPSRLVVDLDAGQMPGSVAGRRITTGGEV